MIPFYDFDEIQRARDPPGLDLEKIQRARDPPGFPFLHGASIALFSDAGDIHPTSNPVDDLTPWRKVTIASDVIKRCKAHNTKVPMKSLIYFVDQLEIQHQYIEFMDFLIENCHFIKHDSSPDDIFNALVKTHQEQEHSKFGKLDKQIIWDCVNDRISKVRAMYKESKLSEFRCWLKCLDISWESPISKDLDVSGPFRGLNTSDRIREIKRYKDTLVQSIRFRCSPKDDRWFPSSLFSELMIRTLKKNDYAMDLNPVSELEKIELSDPVSYVAQFINPQPHKVASIDWSEMVRVDNVSLDATQQDVEKKFSSCGYIQHFVMTSGDKYQTAFVTFTKLEAKKKALLLTDESINNQRIKVASITVYRPDWALDVDDDYDSGEDDADIIKSDNNYESKQVKAARSAKSDVETGGDIATADARSAESDVEMGGAIATAAEVSTMLKLLNKYWSYTRHPAKHERAASNAKEYNIRYYYTHSLSKSESC